MKAPKVSIIIPVYNVEEYIEQTISSLLNQTLKEIEIILIDDGSTDSSREIIKRYSEKYDNINVILQDNSGPSIARNKGIKEATGDYIVFVDSDDLLPEDSLEIRYNTAVKENADLVIGGTYKFNSKRKWPMKKHFLGNGAKNVITDSDILWTVGPCNKIYKSSLIKDLEFPANIKYAEDQVFVVEAYIKAKKIYSINDVIYYYRMRETVGNDSLTQQIYNDSSNVIRQIYDVWRITSDNIDENITNKFFANNIKVNYLNRLAEADIWPAFKSAIISRNKDVQKVALEYAIKLVEYIDNTVLNQQIKFKWIMSKGIVDKYLFIDKSNKKLCLQLITSLFKKMDGESLYKLRLEQKYFVSCMERAVKYQSNIYIYEFLIRRKTKRFIDKFKYKNLKKSFEKRVNKLCTKGVFNLSKILPLKKHTVILATNRSYELEGNLKCINDELNKHKEFRTIVYLKEDKVTKKNLIKMYYNFARAKYIILDDYYRQLYGYKFKENAEVIQVWHACGAFKKFGFSAIGQGDSNSAAFEKKAHSHYTKVITSSKEINKHYAEAFNISEDKVLDLGVPRTDSILDSEYRKFIRLKLEKEYPALKGKKVITYAPTFRGGPKERKNFKCELDYMRIIDTLGDDYVLVLKLHPIVDKESVYIPEEYKDKVLNLTRYKDINDLLTMTDILITDYSSVIFEYSLLERPVILFAYDLENYLDERNFYYDYEKFVPGPIVYNNDQIIELIKNNSFDLEKVKLFKNKFFDDVDGKSTQRIVEFLLKEA